MCRARLAGLVGLFIVASCTPPPAQQPSVREVVGPDGSAMLHVACAADEGQCYQRLGTRCPYGYELFPTVSRDPRKLLARCRAPNWQQRQPGTWAPPPGPTAPSWAPTPTPEDPWRRPKATDPDAGAPDFGY